MIFTCVYMYATYIQLPVEARYWIPCSWFTRGCEPLTWVLITNSGLLEEQQTRFNCWLSHLSSPKTEVFNMKSHDIRNQVERIFVRERERQKGKFRWTGRKCSYVGTSYRILRPEGKGAEREFPRVLLWRDNSVGILSSDFWFLDYKGISVKSQFIIICYRSPWKLT